jgi:hypothetical protein
LRDFPFLRPIFERYVASNTVPGPRFAKRYALTAALLGIAPQIHAQSPQGTSAQIPPPRPAHEIDLALGASWPGSYSSCRKVAAGFGFRFAYLYGLSRPVSIGLDVEHARFSYGLSGGEPDTASTTLIAALFRLRPLQSPVAEPYLELGLGAAIEAAPANPRGPANSDTRWGGGLAIGLPFVVTPALRLGPRLVGVLTPGGQIGVSCVVSSAGSVCEAYRSSHNGFLFAGIEAGLVFEPQDLFRRR